MRFLLVSVFLEFIAEYSYGNEGVVSGGLDFPERPTAGFQADQRQVSHFLEYPQFFFPKKRLTPDFIG